MVSWDISEKWLNCDCCQARKIITGKGGSFCNGCDLSVDDIHVKDRTLKVHSFLVGLLIRVALYKLTVFDITYTLIVPGASVICNTNIMLYPMQPVVMKYVSKEDLVI